MCRRYNARSRSLHKPFGAMQCFHCRLASLGHRRHPLPLELMHSLGRDARSHRFPRSLFLLASFLVRGRVEGDEEHKVGTEGRATREGGELLTSARPDMREGGVELVNVVVVCGVVYESCLQDQPQPRRHRTSTESAEKTVVIPRSMMNCAIWSLVIHSFHQIRMPLAA